MQTDLSIQIGELKLKNPVMTASGTFGYGEEFQESIYDISKLGAVVTKGISLKPRKGNPVPRIVETASGMLNAIGLANVGVEVFLNEKLPFLKISGATVIANIFGESAEEYGELSSLLDRSDVDAVEINISCPNVKAGGIQFGSDPSSAKTVVRAARDKFKRTLIVKLSPQVADIAAVACAAVDAGADAVSLINTIPAMAVDIKTGRPVLANVTGGLSGPAIKPVALKMVFDAARAVKVPVIGIGGIMTATDAIEFILAGAAAVQIGTANFVRPNAAMEVIEGINSYCRERKVSAIRDLIGTLEI